MDEPYDPTRLTLEQIEQQLDESEADAAAGRTIPAEQVLAEMRSRLREYREKQSTANKEDAITTRS